MIDLNLIGWNGWRITIPVFNRDGKLVLFKQSYRTPGAAMI